MAHFGDCCDPFMRLRMASNGYEAISVCHGDAASCVAASQYHSNVLPHAACCLRLASARFWYSRYLVCSCDCDFYFYVSFRIVCFALLCFCSAFVVLFARLSAHVTWQFVWSSHIWQNVAVCLSLCPSVPLYLYPQRLPLCVSQCVPHPCKFLYLSYVVDFRDLATNGSELRHVRGNCGSRVASSFFSACWSSRGRGRVNFFL